MKMQQLLCFREIAKTKNFTTAAGNLYLSQPSVSYNIRELEKELGVPLLNRSFTGGTAELTEYGEVFLESVKEILYLTKECELTFEDIHQYRSSEIRIGCSDRLTFGLIPKLTKYAAFQMPNGDSVILRVRTAYHLSDLVGEIEKGNLDFGLFAEKPPEGFEGEVVNYDHLVAMVPDSHPAAEKTSVRLSELTDLPLALPPAGGTLVNHYIKKMFQEEQLEPTLSEYGGNLVQDRLLGVMLGKCFTITSNFPLDLQGVKMVAIDNPFSRRELYAIWKKGRTLSENERKLLEFCKQYQEE